MPFPCACVLYAGAGFYGILKTQGEGSNGKTRIHQANDPVRPRCGGSLTEIWQKSWRKLGDSEMAETYPENLGRGKPYPDAKGEN